MEVGWTEARSLELDLISQVDDKGLNTWLKVKRSGLESALTCSAGVRDCGLTQRTTALA